MILDKLNWSLSTREKSLGVVAKVLDCSLEVSKIELQSGYYVHFRTNKLEKEYNHQYPSSYGLNNITAFFYKNIVGIR